jgi:Activator of Hsp90 ATPase homolog 1-like protein
MATATLGIDDLIVNITQEIHVKAPLDATFEALIEQLGPHNEKPGGEAMPMVLEAWPGGRWYRDLGNNNGHFWGHVQAIKRPTLLEICGPLFASYPMFSNVQYRLVEESGGTRIAFHHIAFGKVDPEHKSGMAEGWKYLHDQVRKRAENAPGKAAGRGR